MKRPPSASTSRRPQRKVWRKPIERSLACAVSSGALAWMLAAASAHGASVYFDINGSSLGSGITSGASLTWDGASIWNPLLDGTGVVQSWVGGDVAVFSAGSSAAGLLYGITVSGAQTVGGLTFRDGLASLSGGTLNFTGLVALNASIGVSGGINNVLAGSAGLTKSGLGTVRLSSSASTYTGTTTVGAGVLAINGDAALGADVSTVLVTGNASTGTGGGQLLLGGGSATSVSLSRNLSLSGGGTWGDGGALLSVGNNTLSGSVSTTSANTTRMYSAYGLATFSGSLSIGSGQTTVLGGNGNWKVSGSLTLPDTANTILDKQGSGTLLFAPSSLTMGAASELRITLGTMRAASGTALSGMSLSPNGGMLELRTDAPSSFSGSLLKMRGTGSTVFVDRAVGTLAGAGASNLNQTVTLGATSFVNSNNNYYFTGRNGFSLSMGGNASSNITLASGNNTTFNNSLQGGSVIFSGNVTLSDTSQRAITFNGNGETIVTGGINLTSAPHTFLKGGTGMLSLTGTTSTLVGNTQFGGTLSLANLGAINKTSATGGVILSGGTLLYTGAADSLSKSFGIITNNANAILASGTGALTLSGTIAVVSNSKTLYLGGSNTDDNTLGGLVLDGTTTNTTSLAKVGTGTWVIKAPTSPALGAAGSVTLSAIGTSGTTTMTLSTGTTSGLVPGQTVTIGASNYQITAILDSTRFSIGSGLTNVTAGTYTVNVIPAASTTTMGGPWSGSLTIAGGTLKLSAVAASDNIVRDASAVLFNVDAYSGQQMAGGTLNYINNAAATVSETVGTLTATAGAGKVVLTPNGSATTLTFASLGTRSANAVLEFAPSTGSIKFTAAAAGTNSILGGFASLNGTDFVGSVAAGGALAAPTYTTLPATTGSATANYLSAGNTTTTGAIAANSLKINGGGTVTGTGALTITATSATALGGILFDNSSGAGGLSGFTGLGTSGSNQELVITVGGSTPANAFTLGVPLTNGTGSLTKAGSGALVLSAASTFTGSTVINDGTLRLSGSAANLGAATTAAISAVVRQGAVLDLNGAGASSSVSGGPAQPSVVTGMLGGAGTVQNSGAGASTASVLVIGSGTTTTGTGVFSGVLKDNGGTLHVTKAGASASVQYLVGDNTYTGVTTLTGGSLRVFKLADIGQASGIGAGDSTSDATNAASLVLNGGTLVYAGSDATVLRQAQTPSVAINRLFTLTSNGGSIDSSGSYGSSTLSANANHASLVFLNTAPIAFSATNVTPTLTLTGTSTGDNEFKPQLQNPSSGTLALTKSGAGTWVLNPTTSNSYTGNTTVSGGILQVPAESASVKGLPTASLLDLNGGVLQTSGSFTRTLGATAGNVRIAGGASGFAGSSDKLTVTLGGGALTWGSTNFSPSALVLSSATALAEVEIANALDLGASSRTVQVDDNTSAGTDFATLSGVLSGTGGGLAKTGTGTLYLSGANTYSGSTQVSAGTLGVFTMDGSGGSSNLGSSGALILGAGSTTAVTLGYFGAGDTSSRALQLNTSTGAITVEASGSGPVVLSGAVTVPTAGAKTLTLRGFNTDANEIRSVIPNSSSGNTTLSKADPGTWILSGQSTFSGGVSVSGGALGIGASSTGTPISSGPVGLGTLSISSSAVFFAAGGDRALANSFTFFNGTTTVSPFFTGEYSLSIGTGSTAVITNTGNSTTINNTIASGKTLTFGGTVGGGSVFNMSESGQGRTITFTGSGDTVVNAVMANLGNASALTVNTTGSLTLAGSNTYTGVSTLTAGTLILTNSSGALGEGTATNVLTAGTLKLRNNGAGDNGTVIFGSTSNPTGYRLQLNGTVTIDVANVSAGTGNTLQIGNLNIGSATGRTLTITGSNGYRLGVASFDLPNGTGATTIFNPTTAALTIGTFTNPMSAFAVGNFDTITLDGTAQGNRITGSISDATGASLALGGLTRVTKSNTSTWTISFSGNTYLGLTSVTNGTLLSGALNALSTAAGLGTQVNATGAGITATLDFAGFNQSLQVGSGGTGNINASLLLGGTTTTSAPVVAGSGSTLTLSGTTGSNGDVQYVSTNNPLGGVISVSTIDLGGLSRTFNVGDSTSATDDLTISSTIQNGSLLKSSTGTLALTGTSTYSGTTTVSAGILRIAKRTALYNANSANWTSANISVASTGTLALNVGGTGEFTSSEVGTLFTNLNAATGGFASGSFLGIDTTNATGAVTLSQNFSNTNSGSNTFGISKFGTGSLVLSGTNTFTGNVTVYGGSLDVTGPLTGNTTSSTLVYGSTAGTKIVNVSANATLFAMQGGNAAGAVSIYNQTAGTVTLTPGTSNTQYVAKASGSYGYFNLTGGTYKVANRWTTNGSANIGSATNPATAAVGVVYVGGTGFLDNRNADWFLNGYSMGQITVAGGGSIDHTGSSNPFSIFMDSTTAGGTYGTLNIAGGSVLVGAKALQFGNNTSSGSGNTGFINLASGTLSVGVPMASSVNPTGGNSAYIGFAGGTLKTTAAITSWVPASSAGISYSSIVYGAVNNSAAVADGSQNFAGGLTVDTNGFNSSLTNALAAPGGVRVTQADLTITGGSGYVGAPAVVFSTAGMVAGGNPAAGYALISGGAVTGIVITNPGTYTAGTVPTITLMGGGGTGAAVTAGALATLNTSGGLIKNGTGTLTLSAVNTYAGGTTINAGTLGIGANNTLLSTGSVTVNGGTLDMATFSNTVGAVSLQSGSITGTTGVLTSSANFDLQNGSVSAALTGSLGLTKSTAGSVVLSGNNTISGPLVISGGTLSLTTAAALPLAPSALTVAGGATLNLVNGTAQTVDLGGGALSLGAGSGTTTLGVELGSAGASDSITTSGTATTANAVRFDFTALAGFGNGSYTLLSAASGLGSATYSLGSLGGGVAAGKTFSLSTAPTAVQVAVADTTASSLYWKGGMSSSWVANNFTTDLAGSTLANGTPGAVTSVLFSASGQSATSLSTTLDAAFSIRSLSFNNNLGSGPLASITIAAGSSGTLTLTPASSSDGIDVQTGAPAAITLSAPLVLGASQTWNVADSATVLSVSGGTTGTGAGITKTGNGILALSGTNTYSGATTVNGGVLRAGATSAFSANSAHVLGSSGTLRLNGFANTIASLAGFAGAVVDNGAASGNVVLTIGGDNSSTTFAGSLRDGAAATLGLTKTGTGTLTLSGTSTYTGLTTIDGGTLRLDGASITPASAGGWLVANAAASKAVVEITTGSTLRIYNNNPGLRIGMGTGSTGVVNQSGGTVDLQGANSNFHFNVGGVTGAFGAYNQSGGTITGGQMEIGPSGTGIMTVSGGNFAATGGTGSRFLIIGRFANSIGVLTVAGANGQTPTVVGGASGAGVSLGWTDTGNSRRSELNIGPNANVSGGASSYGLYFRSAASSTGVVEIANLYGGTLSVGLISTAGNPTSIFNFNGGTLQATQAASGFMTGLTAAYVYSGGAVVDSNSCAITIGQSLLAPTGAGVGSLSLTGSGYLSAPYVSITGDGTGATAIATIDASGTLTGYTITNPGVGYTTASVTLSGGGGTGSGTATLNGGNTSGGLTKIGAGTLTLTGTNTFTGPLVINAGTVAVATFNDIGTNGPLGAGDNTSTASRAASLVLNGGTLSYTGAAVVSSGRLLTVGAAGGSLDASGTTTNTLSFTATSPLAFSGSGSRTLTLGGTNTSTNAFGLQLTDANAGSDALTLAKTGAGTWSLSNASNTHTGGTTIGGGVLSFVSGALGSSGAITFTGNATLQWAGVNSQDLSSRLALTNGFVATLDTNGNDLVLANTLATVNGTGATLAKIGTGALTLNAAAAFTGGVTLTAGSLNIGHASALGSGTFTIGAATFNNTSGAALTLAQNPPQTWSGDFTFTGTNDLNLGSGAVTLSANRSVTVPAGTLTVDGVIDDGASTFTLTKAGAGTLYLRGANTFGSASTISINGGVLKIDAESGLGVATNRVTFTNSAILQVTTGFNTDPSKLFTVTNAGGATFQVDSGRMTINSVMGASGTSTGGLIKKGAGTLALTAGSTSFDSTSVGVNGAATAGFRVDGGELLVETNTNNVLGDVTPNTIQVQLNGGHFTVRSDTVSIARANLYVSAPATLTTDNITAGPGILQNIGTGTGAQLTMGTGSSVLTIAAGSNVTSGTATVQFGATTLLADSTFNITNPVGATTQLTLGAVTGGTSSITLTGGGSFIQTGVITSSAGFTLGSTYTGTATLSQSNAYAGATTVNGGTLAFSTSANLGTAGVTNTLAINGGTLSYTGTTSVDLGANRALTIGASGATLHVPQTNGTLTLSGGVTATGNLTKTGAGALVLSGTTTLNSGAGAVTVSDGTLQAGFGTSGIATLSVSGTSAMSFVNNAAQVLTLAGSNGALSLAGGARIGLELGSAGSPGTSDQLVVGAGGTAVAAGNVTLDLYSLSGFGAGTYNLLSAPGGLSGATWLLGTAPTGYNYSITATDTLVSLGVVAYMPIYWTNSRTGGSWATVTTDLSNWSSDAAGTANATRVPASTDTVIFSATNAPFTSTTQITTTLDGSYTIDGLQFIAAPTTVSAVTLSQGTGGGTLTLAPSSSSSGIYVGPNAGAATISAPVVAGTTQTWNVDGTGTSSLTLSGAVTFSAPVTKSGTGALTLSGGNSGAGGISLMGGTLKLGSATALGSGSLSIAAGTTLDATAATVLSTTNALNLNGSFTFTGAQNLTFGAGAATLGRSVTVTTSANTLTIGGAIGDGAGSYGLAKAGTGTLVLNGANTYDGLTDVTAGILTLAGNNAGMGGGVTLASGVTLNINHAAALGTGTLTLNGGTINNTSGSAITLSTVTPQTWAANFAFTGGSALHMGAGAVQLTTSVTATLNASTLTLAGPVRGNSSSTLTFAGSGALVLSGLSATASDNFQGGLILSGPNTTLTSSASLTGALTFGNNNTATALTTLNLNAASLSHAGAFTVQTNNASANTITIGAGQALNLTSTVTIGSGAGSNTTTALTVTGLGAFNVANTASSGTFTVGGTSGTSGAGSTAVADFSGLASMSLVLSGTASAINVYPNITTGTTNVANLDATLRLAASSILTTKTLTVGGGPTHNGGVGQRNELYLGSTSTQINADTINIGTGSRDMGWTGFSGSTGSLTIRAQNGTGRAALNIATGTGVGTGTLGALNALVLAGHQADLLLGAVSMGTQHRANDYSAALTFDTGTLDMTSLTLSTRTAAAAISSVTSTVSIGGGTVAIQSGVLAMGSASGDYTTNPAPLMAAVINVSGGAVTIGNTSGTSLAMGSYTATNGTGTGSAAGTLNITGGTVTLNGNIVRSTASALSSATVTLDGGTLDMGTKNIGTTNAVVFNARSGTLKNVGEINSGAGFTKTTAGTLVLDGTNTYTGGTTISAGVLQIGTGSASGTLGSGGVVNNASLVFNRSDSVTVGNAISGSGSLTHSGAGTTTLSGTNTFSGAVTVNAGTLVFSAATALGDNSATNVLSLNSGALSYTGSGSATLGANQALSIGAAGGTINVSQSAGALTFAASTTGSGNLTKTGQGTLTLSGTTNLTGSTLSVSDGKVVAGFGTSGLAGLVVGATGHMSFINNSVESLGSLTSLSLTGGAQLGFEFNGLTNDSLTFANAASVGGTITLNLAGFGSGVTATTYTLLTGGSGLNAASFVVGTAPAGFNYTLNRTDSSLTLTAVAYSPIYWRGGQNLSWNTLGASAANWSADAAGTVDSTHTPLSHETIIFSAANAPTSGGLISTTLDAAFTTEGLQFTAAPSSVSAVQIAAGSGGALTVNASGIQVAAGAGTITISAPITVGAAQSWNVASSGALLLTGNLTFSNPVSKIGAGALTLGGTNSGSGGVTLSAGTLNLASTGALGSGALSVAAGTTIDNTSGGALTVAGSGLVQNWNGSFTFTGTSSLTLGTGGAVNLGNHITVTTAGALTTLSVPGAITDGASSFALTKAGPGALTLAGNNTFDGGVTLTAGTLNVNHAGALGTGTLTLADGVILDNTSGASVTNSRSNAQAWNGSFTFTGSQALNLGNGPVTLGATPTVTVTASTLTAGGVVSGSFGLTKTGSGTLALTGLSATAASNYSGTTTLVGGTLALSGTAALSGGLTFGASAGSTATAALDLSSGSATFGSLLVQTNSASANTVIIGSGKTLAINGNFTMGYDALGGTVATQSRLTASGAGALSITGTTVTIGVNQAATNALYSSAGTLDVSGLGSFSANVTSFNLGVGGTSAGAGTVLLSNTANTLLATTLTVGDTGSNNGSGTSTLTLGAGTNIIQADTINIGRGKGSGPGVLKFAFQAPGSSGTVTIANKAGTGAANLDIGNNNSASTAGGAIGTLDLTGHTATVNAGTLAIGRNNMASSTGSTSGTVSFDAGTFTVATVDMAAKTGAGTGAAVAALNIGGGTFTVNTAFTLGSQTSAGTSSATLTLTGGTLTSNVAILDGGGSTTSKITLNGGVLDMTAHNIGGITAIDTLEFFKGTLKNVAQINSGAPVTLGSSGNTLILEGTNSFTGTVTVPSGATLQVGTGSSSGTLGSGAVTNNGSLVFNRTGSLTVANTISGSGSLTHVGTGVTTLSGTNTFSGAVSVSAGTLSIGAANNLGNASSTNSITLSAGTLQSTGASVNLGANRTLSLGTGGGTLDVSGSNVLTLSGAISGSTSLTKTGTGTLDITSTTGSFTGSVNASGGTLQMTGTLAGVTSVTVTSGTLILGANERINDAASLAMAGGTFNVNGFSETLGTLTLSANSTIDFGTGANAGASSILIFSGAGSFTAGQILAFTNFGATGTDRVLFSNSVSGVLGQISLNGSLTGETQVSFNGSNYYELTAVPEPSTWIAGGLLLGLLAYRERRRFKRE